MKLNQLFKFERYGTIGIIISSLVVIIIGLSIYFFTIERPLAKKNIPIGILFSKTGTMALSEQPLVKSTQLAIDEINAKGGVDGHKLVPIIADAGSNWERAAQLAQAMITQKKVIAIIGCWTSACRKTVEPIISKYDNLLIYPTQYEGIEQSPNVIYLGATPNQQVIPAVKWFTDKFGKNVYLVGSDYIYPHVANEIIKSQVTALGGQVVGTSYIPIGSQQVDTTIQEIIATKPDAIINTINGDTNISFFTKLNEALKNQTKIPVMSFSLSSSEIKKLPTTAIEGHYSAWPYIRALNTSKNKAFLEAYKRAYGSTEELNSPAVSTYSAIYLIAQALQQRPEMSSLELKQHMLRQSINSPAGTIYIDPQNSHAWRQIIIAQVDANKNLKPVWSSIHPIEPIVYPAFKTKAEWNFFEYNLFLRWNRSWENKAQ